MTQTDSWRRRGATRSCVATRFRFAWSSPGARWRTIRHELQSHLGHNKLSTAVFGPRQRSGPVVNSRRHSTSLARGTVSKILS